MRFWRSLVRFHGTIAFFGMIAVVFGLLAALAGEPSGVFTAGVGVGLLGYCVVPTVRPPRPSSRLGKPLPHS